LLQDGRPVMLGSRALDLLIFLVQRHDRLVSKAELLDAVWPGLVVEESNVHVQVSNLRKSLGTQAIATVPGLGYRFVLPLVDRAAVLPAAQPDSASAPARLPNTLAPLVGREQVQRELVLLLRHRRLVCMVGPGGVGKTRLALAVAHELEDSREATVRWADLGAIAQPSLVPESVAHAIGAQLPSQGDAIDGLLLALQWQPLLLVLDGCEHLLPQLAEDVERLLAGAPSLRVLCTSQAPLHIEGESVLRLAPLELPPPEPAPGAPEAAALRLLLQQARCADQAWRLAEGELPDAVRLVRCLDGLPLAIEMAAARLPALGLATLLQHLGDRLDLLRKSAGRRTPPRHQSLRATLEWSYALLAAGERHALRQLACFAGSFDSALACRTLAPDAAAGGAYGDAEPMRLLATLIDKSLVHSQPAEAPRLRILDALRLFCGQQRSALGEDGDMQLRHGQALAERALQVEEDFWALGDAVFLGRHAGLRSDLQSAFDAALGRRDACVAGATGLALMRLDHLRNVHGPRRRRAEQLHALLPMAGPLEQAWIWSCIASHGLIATDFMPRLQAAEQAAAAWRALDAPMPLHFALGFLASECARAGDLARAQALLQEAVALERPDWPLRRLVWRASASSGVAIYQADGEAYRAASRLELQLADAAGAEGSAAWASLKLADAAQMAGALDEAVALGRSAVARLRSLRQPSNLGLALSNLCAATLLLGLWEEAVACARESLPLMARAGWLHLLLDPVALIAARRGEAAQAAQLLDWASAWYTRHQELRQPNEARIAAACEALITRPAATDAAAADVAAGDERLVIALAQAVLDRAAPSPLGVSGFSTL
jgi:predicted ATPase